MCYIYGIFQLLTKNFSDKTEKTINATESEMCENVIQHFSKKLECCRHLLCISY